MMLIELDERHRKANHVPKDLWQLSRAQEVCIRVVIAGESVQVLDCTGPECQLGGREE